MMIAEPGSQGIGNKNIPEVISADDRWWLWKEMYWIVPVVGTAILARIVFVLVNDAFYDDAYITFRYARNLIEGHGLVYNYGEHVYGASSPLYTFICVGIIAVFGEPLLPSIARWLGTAGIILFVLTVVPVIFWRKHSPQLPC